jgi:hypothetical protein
MRRQLASGPARAEAEAQSAAHSGGAVGFTQRRRSRLHTAEAQSAAHSGGAVGFTQRRRSRLHTAEALSASHSGGAVGCTQRRRCRLPGPAAGVPAPGPAAGVPACTPASSLLPPTRHLLCLGHVLGAAAGDLLTVATTALRQRVATANTRLRQRVQRTPPRPAALSRRPSTAHTAAPTAALVHAAVGRVHAGAGYSVIWLYE